MQKKILNNKMKLTTIKKEVLPSFVEPQVSLAYVVLRTSGNCRYKAYESSLIVLLLCF